MPYTKSGIYYTLKSGPPRRTSTKKRYDADRQPKYLPGASQGASTGRSGYQFVPRTVGAMGNSGEMKYFDCEEDGVTLTVVTTGWVAANRVDPSSTIDLGSAAVATPLCLFAPTVGSGLNQRIGRKVYMHKLKIRGYFSISSQSAQSTADSASTIRMLVLMDKQTNGAQYTASSVLNSSTTTTGIWAYQNPNGFGRFTILKDKMFNFSNINMTGSPTAGDVIQTGMNIPFKFNFNFKTPIQVNFNATNGGTVADIIDNSLHIMVGVSSTAPVPSLSYYTRVCYKE